MSMIVENVDEVFYVVFPTEEGITTLLPNSPLPVDEVAKKDVPFNVPYLIVAANDFPATQKDFDSWAPDFSAPSGYGLGPHRWYIEIARRAIDQGINTDYHIDLIDELTAQIANDPEGTVETTTSLIVKYEDD